MTREFDVAVGAVRQFAFDVITHVTASLLARDVDVKVAELVPAFTPFTFHW
jgi:hypothetical protein